MDWRTIGLGAGGAAVVGVAFGMARYAYGLTLPDVRAEFGLSEPVLGLIASGTFVGFLVGLVSAPRLAGRRGPRAPTTVGGVCGTLGASAVALAPEPGLLAAGAVLTGSAAGWVWAPYSDIVTRAAPRRHHSTLLALITTGTSLGLLALAALGLLAATTSWRVVWAGTGVAAAAAAAVNLVVVPRLRPRRPVSATGQGKSPVWRGALVPPLAFAVLYTVAVAAYLTYAGEAVRSGGLSSFAAPLLFALVGVSGVAGLGTGRLTRVAGAPAVAVGSVVVVASALLLLAVGSASLAVVVVSALVFGVGYMVGSAVLAIWTAQVVPHRPGDAFTSALVVGAVTSISTPAVVGLLIPELGLGTTLGLAAAVAALGAMALVPAVRRSRGAPPRWGDVGDRWSAGR